MRILIALNNRLKRYYFALRKRFFVWRCRSLYFKQSFFCLKENKIINQRLQQQLAATAEKFKSTAQTSAFLNHPSAPKISIIMPVYRVSIEYLSAVIDSVLWQIYPYWELCIVDDASQSEAITNLLSAQQDKRIKIKFLNKNAGISAASNHALDMATGEYIALLDNDDLLTHDALEKMAACILDNPKLDMLYSDECKLDASGRPIEIFAKPDWSPTLMLNCMYTAHLTLYRKALVHAVGAFRTQYDFSQDYDLALRISEATQHIHHVGAVLYGWRMIEQSAAAGGKPYARESNRAAVQDAITRRGLAGQVIALQPAINKLSYAPTHFSSLVSIIIPSHHKKQTQAAIDHIKATSSYPHYEIIIVSPTCEQYNLGVKRSQGEYIIFYQPKTRILSKHWIESMLEYLSMDSVGIVGPKLLYKNQHIQHAGMVTGVRGLVGSAFYGLHNATSLHYNFAQSVREVSCVSDRCFGIKRYVFESIGLFDTENTPAAHAVLDVCFKVRAQGLSCVYTPYATLQTPFVPNKPTFSLWLLKNWGHYIANDPFYPQEMRALLYNDSPASYAIFAPKQPIKAQKNTLITTHTLAKNTSQLFDTAKAQRDAGHFVVITAQADGPIREDLQALDVTIIIDSVRSRKNNLSRHFDSTLEITA